MLTCRHDDPNDLRPNTSAWKAPFDGREDER